ncbi:MAG: EamA family transporter, partial [Moorella sp. (in: Bacteria)]|nr:EamA family transporter [Moorella sp. (in: firmicutes)]
MQKGKCHSYESWGLFLSALAATALGLEGVAAKMAYAGGANIPTTLALRFLAAAAFFWCILALDRRPWRLEQATLGRLAILALGGQAVTVLLLFYAFQHIPAALAILFFYLYPVVVAILAVIFLHEPLTRAKVGALLLALAGLIIILGVPTGGLDVRGLTAALLAALANGIYLVGQTRLLKRLEPRVFNAYATLIMGCAFFLLALATGTLDLSLDRKAIVAIAILSLVCTVLAYTAIAWGLRYIGASRVAIISTIEPVV